MDILLRTPHLKLSEELQDVFEGALLVRQNIKIDEWKSARQYKGKNDSPLRLFPCENFFSEAGLSINDIAIIDNINKKEFIDTLSSGFRFYSGVGLSKTDVFTVNPIDSTGVMLKYVLPKMQRLRKETGQLDNSKTKIFNLFLTSSIEEVTNSKMRAGYLYNLFENENNFFHFNARIRYCTGTPRDSMYFEITDLESANPSDKIIKTANQEFALQSKSNLNNFQWLFQVEDMRASNTLGWGHIFWFVAIFILLVYVRMIFSKSISILELSIYVVVFCFGVIRLILTWRMSTFPPTEGVDPSVFYKMHDGFGEAKWTYIIFILPILFWAIGYWSGIKDFWRERIQYRLPAFENWDFVKQCSVKLDKIKNWHYNNQGRPFFYDFWWIIALYFVFLVICGVLSKLGFFPRFMNIPIPILMFFLFSNWLKKKHKNVDSDSLLRKIQKNLLGLLTIGYLAYQDAGFAVIFLLYLAIHWGIVALWCDTNRDWKKIYIAGKEIEILKIGLSILFVALAIAFLYYEGNILLYIFEKTGVFVIAVGIFLASLTLYLKKQNSELDGRTKKIIFRIILSFGIAFIAIGTIETVKVWNPISDYLNESKSYVKYRAKAQQPDVSISDMLRESDFSTNDVEYIMRSAHNQWFINEYNAAASSNEGFWTLQPHFNQGSTYTTQTTDLVVVRYILAEHGVMVLIWLMALLLLLLIIYAYDVRLEKTESFTILGVFILLFSIALFVCLSANNKIVFFGQDFPFLSLTSKIAVFFPIALFALAVWQRMFRSDDSYQDENSVQIGKLGMSLSILVFTCIAVLCLPSKGKSTGEEEDARRFDVSALINETANKVADLDRELQKYQYTLDNVDKISRDTIWHKYTERGELWKSALANKDDKFFSSLLEHFNNPTTNKYNPEELLHLRRRNGYLHLAVNRKYYFIRSFRQKDLQWTGDLKAAKTDRIFSFSKNGEKTEDNYNTDIIPDIFKHENVIFRDKVSNLTLMRLDSSWTADHTPIYLISSEQGKSSHQYYDISADDYSKIGSAGESQLSVRLLPNDLMTLKRKDGNRETVIDTWKYGENDERFLAKNIWLNGSQRLFYPLGKQSMWTFHFANLVNQTYGKTGNEQFKDSTIRISIDFDLTERLYEIVKKDNNKPKSGINNETENRLLAFRGLLINDKKNASNTSVLYFDNNAKKVHVQGNNYKNRKDLEKGVAYLNKELRKLLSNAHNAEEVNARINEAIDITLEKQYDYSAVILDGNGRIRALFDYSHLNKPDPNNILYYNRFLSDMYKESSIRSEIDYLGNKSLQLLIPGPGSSFKPIAYTAVTSQAKINWNDLNLSSIQPDPKKVHKKDTKPKVAYYGGLDFDKLNQNYWDLDYGSGLNHNDYLIRSNNLYHSIMILLGTQTRETLEGNFEGLYKSAGNDALSFPIIKYKGKSLSFNPDRWYGKNYTNEYFNVSIDDAVLNLGLKNNFHLSPSTVEGVALYNAFGSENYLSILYNSKQSYNFGWAYPSIGSMNNADRNEQPFVRNGLIQMSLGANPLEVSPLQMATFGMRLATLNRAENLTTLSDDAKRPEYKLFHLNYAWDSTAYVSFYTNQVLGQLRQVPIRGTASALNRLVNQHRGYYIYAKTGTLNITDKGKERLKHLLVIISNTQLENIKTVTQLQEVKYYVLYLSFYGIGKDEFSSEGFDNYKQVIEATIQSEQFKKYMNSK